MTDLVPLPAEEAEMKRRVKLAKRLFESQAARTVFTNQKERSG